MYYSKNYDLTALITTDYFIISLILFKSTGKYNIKNQLQPCCVGRLYIWLLITTTCSKHYSDSVIRKPKYVYSLFVNQIGG